MNNTRTNTLINSTFEDWIKILPQSIVDKLNDLKGMRERPDFHPEESAFIHVKIVTERLIRTGDIDLIIAGIFHDIAKFDTMKINPKTGHPTSPGHDSVGARLVVDHSNWVASTGADVEKR